MTKRTYTILVVPEHSSRVRRLKIPHRLLLQSAIGGIAALTLASFMLVHYCFIVDQASENRGLKNENVHLKTRVRLVQEELARIDGHLQRIDQFSTKIRGIIQVNDPERSLAMGPLEPERGSVNTQVLYAPPRFRSGSCQAAVTSEPGRGAARCTLPRCRSRPTV